MSNSNAMPIIAVIRRARNALRRLIRLSRRRVRDRQSSPDLSSILVDTLPVHAYIVLEPNADELQSLLAGITPASGQSCDHIPVIFTDSTDFSAIAESGILFEYIPDRETWQHYRQDRPWDAFIRERLAELRGCYRPSKTVVVSCPGDLSLG